MYMLMLLLLTNNNHITLPIFRIEEENRKLIRRKRCKHKRTKLKSQSDSN